MKLLGTLTMPLWKGGPTMTQLQAELDKLNNRVLKRKLRELKKKEKR